MMRSRSENVPKKSVVTPIEQQIKKAKSDKALFELLLPYKKESPAVDTALVQLEENLYRGANNSVDKKGLIDYFNREENEIELV
jgi:23S rRNA C2498 (ribose-2'-O)-methylase RlmM